MESYRGTNTAATAPLYFWRSAQPSEQVYQTVWPLVPVLYSYEAGLPRASHPAHEYAGVGLPPLAVPGFYNTVTRQPNPRLSHTEQELKTLANYMRADLTMGDSTNTRNDPFHEQLCHVKQLAHLQDGFQTPGGFPMMQEPKKCPNVEKDPVGLMSLFLDSDLGECGERGKPMHISQTLMTTDQTAAITYAKVSPLQSEQSTIENTSPSKYCSFDSIKMYGTDTSSIQSAELKQLNFPQGLENGTKKQGQDYTAYNYHTAINDHEANLGLKDRLKAFQSIMEEDMSILACVPRDGQKSFLAPVTNNRETVAGSSELMESDHSISKRCTEDKGISPIPRDFTCDVMVGTELAQCVSASTQTADSKATTDKHINTEVQMADLDYVAMEFFKLKKAKEKLEENEKMKSSACKLGSGCDCFKRAQQAELSLLTLQYIMCRQHCWSLYYINAVGDQVKPLSGGMNLYWPKDPPANILGVLEKLDSDYNVLRDKIQEGISLEELIPLSVDCGKLTSATYVPAQIIANLRGSLLSQCPPELQRNSTESDKDGCPNKKSTNDSQREAEWVTQENCKARRAVTLVPRGRGPFPVVQKLIEKRTTACKALTIGEVWYDAEEDLEPAEPAAAAEMGQNYKFTAKSRTCGSASEEGKSSVLSNLTCDATGDDSAASGLEQQQQAGGLCPAHTKGPCAIASFNTPMADSKGLSPDARCSVGTSVGEPAS